MLEEVRQAMLLARLNAGLLGASQSGQDSPALMSARIALELATKGGAAVLGREDIGSLEQGKCADFFAVNLNHLNLAGALHDPVAAVVLCSPIKSSYTVVHGKTIVSDGNLTTIDLQESIKNHNEASFRIAN